MTYLPDAGPHPECDHEWTPQRYMGFGYVRECVKCQSRQNRPLGQVNYEQDWEFV